MTIRIKLDEEDFRALIAGKVVAKQDTHVVEIALDDIGFELMLQALRNAMAAKITGPLCECGHPYKDHHEFWAHGGDMTYRCRAGACSCSDFKEAPQ